MQPQGARLQRSSFRMFLRSSHSGRYGLGRLIGVPLRDPARELDAVRGAGYLKWLEPGIRRSLADKNGPQVSACGPSGGLFGIDQEVVTRKASGWMLWPLRRTPGPGATCRRADIPPNSPLSCEGLRATALSLSHLTWSMGTSITVRTCHQTTSFPVYLQNSSQATWVQVPWQRPLKCGRCPRKSSASAPT